MGKLARHEKGNSFLFKMKCLEGDDIEELETKSLTKPEKRWFAWFYTVSAIVSGLIAFFAVSPLKKEIIKF